MKYNKKIFIEKALIKHDGKYDYSLVKYVNSQTKVKIICSKHGIFEQTPSMHLLRNGCPLCGNEQKSITKLKDLNWFMDRAMLVHNNRYDYSLVKYVNSQTKVKIICSKHGIFEQQVNSHLNGRGCFKCGIELKNNKNSSNKIDFIINATKIHGNKYDYSNVNYLNNKTKVKIICSKHGIFEQTPNAHLSGKQGCPYCKESKGEMIIRNILEYNQINYKYEKNFNNCKNLDYLYYDFYIPEQNLLIEFDGIQHYKPIKYFGGMNGLIEQQYRDKIKNEYALKNNINLIRIKYNRINNIENILRNEKIIK